MNERRKAYPNELFHARVNSGYGAKKMSDERARKRKARGGSGEAYDRAMASMAPKNYNIRDAEWLTNTINRVLADVASSNSSKIDVTIKELTTKDPRKLVDIANAAIANMRNNGADVAVGGLTLNGWLKIRDLASRGYTANTEATIKGQFGGETYYSWRNRK